jgi:excisionase family DNA binding protein
MNPLAHSIAEASEVTDTCRTVLYDAINSGELRAVKRGRRTLILDEDLRRYVQNLPTIAVRQSATISSKSGITDCKDDDASERNRRNKA